MEAPVAARATVGWALGAEMTPRLQTPACKLRAAHSAICWCYSVAKSSPTLCDPHGQQHTRLPLPSLSGSSSFCALYKHTPPRTFGVWLLSLNDVWGSSILLTISSHCWRESHQVLHHQWGWWSLARDTMTVAELETMRSPRGTENAWAQKELYSFPPEHCSCVCTTNPINPFQSYMGISSHVGSNLHFPEVTEAILSPRTHPQWSQSTDTRLCWRKEQCLLQMPSKEPRQPVLKTLQLSDDLQRKIFRRQGEGGGHEVRDQLVDILLNGGWWGNWESASSTFWFQLIWGLRARGQHTVKFFHLLGVSVSAKQLRGHGSEYYPYWGDSKCRWFCLMAKLLYYLSCLTVVLCFCIFSLLQLKLFFGTQGRPRRIKIFYKQESSGWETQGGSWGILLGYTKDKMKTVCLFTLLKGNPIPLTLFLPVKFDLTSLLLAFVLQMKFHGLAQKYLLMFINTEQCKTEMSVPSPHSSYQRPCCVIEVVQSTSSVTLNIRWNLIFTERQCRFRGCWTLVWMLVATTK